MLLFFSFSPNHLPLSCLPLNHFLLLIHTHALSFPPISKVIAFTVLLFLNRQLIFSVGLEYWAHACSNCLLMGKAAIAFPLRVRGQSDWRSHYLKTLPLLIVYYRAACSPACRPLCMALCAWRLFVKSSLTNQIPLVMTPSAQQVQGL